MEIQQAKEKIIKYKEEREREIVRTSAIGAIANTILSGFKIILGLLSNSTVILLDGVETLSNALGSVVTIIGIKLSGKSPDKKHPLGYGRIEYMSDLIVSFIILYIGVRAFTTSIKSILNPEKSTYTYLSFMVLIISALVKLTLSRHERNTGFKYKSRSLVGAAFDSFFNALVSISILLSAFINYKFSINLESYISLIISLIIIRGGVLMFKTTMEEILGKQAKPELIREIKNSILTFDQVMGVYDMILHSYGRDRYIGSAHIEIPSTVSSLELDLLQRRISEYIFLEHSVYLAGLSVYTVNVEDQEIFQMYKEIKDYIGKKEKVLDVHGILIDKKEKKIFFDVIIDVFYQNKDLLLNTIGEDLSQRFPGYKVKVLNDLDI